MFIGICDSLKEKHSELQTERKEQTNAVSARSPAEESLSRKKEGNVQQCLWESGAVERRKLLSRELWCLSTAAAAKM